MADISLQLDTTEYPLTVVDGTTLTLSFNGAAGPSGPSGPNAVTTNTLTTLEGYIYGDGVNITGAKTGSAYSGFDNVVERNSNGSSVWDSSDANFPAITASNSGDPADGSGNSIYASGSGGIVSESSDGCAFVGTGPNGDFLAVNQGFRFISPVTTSGRTAISFGWNDPGGFQFVKIKDFGQIIVGGQTFSWPSTYGGTIAVSNASQSWSGTQTFSGAMVFTSTTRPTSSGTGTPAATSLMTLGDTDTRYGTPYNLFLTSDISSSSTTYVDGSQTITLPAGTYEVEASLLGLTASSTGGVELNVKLSGNNDTATSIQVIKTANISANGSAATTQTTLRSGSSLLYVCLATHADAANKACAVLTKGTFTLSASTIFTPQVKQRTTTDSANAAKFLSGSYLRFIKR
jgi:hypothetical protein